LGIQGVQKVPEMAIFRNSPFLQLAITPLKIELSSWGKNHLKVDICGFLDISAE